LLKEVWIAASDDIPGLVTEAETSEQLVRKLRILIPELLEANGNPCFSLIPASAGMTGCVTSVKKIHQKQEENSNVCN